jgi:mannose-binding lectin 1
MAEFVWVLVVCCHAFNLVPPHVETNANEIGNWTLRGTSTILKQFIRLTPASPNNYGSICQRVPSLFKNWIFEMEISASGGNGGRGFWFYFTKELCPAIPLKFTGFCVWINTSTSNQTGFSPFFFIQNKGSSVIPREIPASGSVKLRSEITTLKLRIRRVDDHVLIEATKDGGLFQRVFEATVSDLIDYGYFTVASLTTVTTDNNDLVSITVHPLSKEAHDIASNLSAVNRRIIENSVESRREKKATRRELMERVWRYAKAGNLSDSNSEYNFTDALQMVEEMRNRAVSTITCRELMSFIDTRLSGKVNAAYEKVREAGQKFHRLRADMQEIWAKLRDELLKLAEEVMAEMGRLETESRDAALHVTIKGTNLKDFKKNLRSRGQKILCDKLDCTLWLLAIPESIGFVIFMLRRRRKMPKKFH